LVESFGISKEEKQVIRAEFFDSLDNQGVSKKGLAIIWNFSVRFGRKPVLASQIASDVLIEHGYDSPMAVAKVLKKLNDLKQALAEKDEEWETFILHLTGSFGKYNKKILREYLSIIGSQEMRELFLFDFSRFVKNQTVLYEQYSIAYAKWFQDYQDRLLEEMDQKAYEDDLARPVNGYHLNSLPLEFVLPRDLAELDFPEPKINKGYRFPISGF